MCINPITIQRFLITFTFANSQQILNPNENKNLFTIVTDVPSGILVMQLRQLDRPYSR